jgi:putative transposase
LKNRGLIRPPKIFVGDAKLGLWKPLRAMSVAIRQQHCWTHKTAELRAGFPPNMQARIEAKMQEIFMAPRRDEAIGPFDLFVRNSPKEAGACLAADKETLLTFHDFPVEHWPYLRNTNSITSIFDTIDLSAYSADGAIGIEQGIILAFKLAQSAQKHWRKLSASPLLADVLKGTAFIDGVKAAA